MKKTLLTVAAMLSCSMAAMAQTAEDAVYVFENDQPDFLRVPCDTAMSDYTDDMIQWLWGKTQRNTARGQQASYESLCSPAAVCHIMAEALGLDTISAEATPALARLITKIYHTGDQCAKRPKDQYQRTRPFVQLGEAAFGQWDGENLRNDGSYPSEHATFGWATALVFAEMWPELQDTILRRGIQFGENRVITGAHYQSDVTAGYMCGAACVARAHANPALQKDIKAARAEYAQLKGLPADYDPLAKVGVPLGEKILNNPVDTASYRFISDITHYWNTKPLRTTERGQRAAVEAEYSTAMVAKVYGEAMDILITKEQTPAIWALLDTVLLKSSETVDRLKEIRFRKRPFVQLAEPSFVPGDEEKERGKSSFPSGHTSLGWSEALVMAEVAPEKQDTILRRGYEYGENRMIVGYHWFTDIEATRQLASAFIANMHAGEGFCEMIRRARAEYLEQTTAVQGVRRTDGGDGRSYRLSGAPATEATRGLVIRDGQKIVR